MKAKKIYTPKPRPAQAETPSFEHFDARAEKPSLDAPAQERQLSKDELIALLERSYNELQEVFNGLIQDTLPVLLLIGKVTDNEDSETEDLRVSFSDQVSYCSFQTGAGRAVQLVARAVNNAMKRIEENESAVHRPMQAYNKAKAKSRIKTDQPLSTILKHRLANLHGNSSKF